MREPAENTANPKQIKAGKRRDRKAADLYLNAVRELMRSPAARLVFSEWIDRAAIYRPALGNESRGQLAYDAGRRAYGLELMQDLEGADRKLFDLLLHERRERLARSAEADEADRIAAASEDGS